jgi:hypothetical protein
MPPQQSRQAVSERAVSERAVDERAVDERAHPLSSAISWALTLGHACVADR